jgi:hypothetical protein
MGATNDIVSQVCSICFSTVLSVSLVLLIWLYTYAPKLVFLIQDHMAHGSHAMFTQAGYNDPSQDESSHMHFGMAPPGALQSQVTCLSTLFCSC